MSDLRLTLAPSKDEVVHVTGELVPIEAELVPAVLDTVTVIELVRQWGMGRGNVIRVLAQGGADTVGKNKHGAHLYRHDQAQRAYSFWQSQAQQDKELVPRKVYPERGRTLDPDVAALIFESMPKQTRAAYGKAWAKFVRFCEDTGRTPYPATGEDLANFIGSLVRNPTRNGTMIAPSSLEIASAAVRTYHRLCAAKNGDIDVAPPDSYLAGKAIKAYRQRWLLAGNRPKASKPLNAKEIKKILPYFDLDTIGGVRDKAIFLLGHGHSSRREELCLIDIADVTFTDYGMDVYLAMSKTDQDGRGATTELPFGQHPESCRVHAVKALVALMASRGITKGPLFQPIDLHGKRFAGEPEVDALNWVGSRGDRKNLLTKRLTGYGIEKIVKKYVKKAGLTGRYTPHGLRSGGLSDRADGGADESELIDAGRYKIGSTMPQRYVRRAKGRRSNSLKNVDL